MNCATLRHERLEFYTCEALSITTFRGNPWFQNMILSFSIVFADVIAS